jgi:hypothetical protein
MPVRGSKIARFFRSILDIGSILAHSMGIVFAVGVIFLIWAGPTLAIVWLAAKIVKSVMGW